MKKAYTKPQIVFESFSLSTNIAANCEVTDVPHDQFVCAIPDDSGSGLSIFDPNYSGGCIILIDKARYNSFCYHIPDENNNLFSS